MTSFAKRYEERKEQFRREVIDHYNEELNKANNDGKLLQVALDSASQYLTEENTEALVAKGALIASAVVGGIVAVAATVNAPSQLLSSSLFAASATLGIGVVGGLTYHSRISESEKIEKLSEALFKKEISNLQDNPRFGKYMDILFEIAEGKGDKEFLKNTMLFSEEFTKKVIEEKKELGYLMSASQFISKGISDFNKKVIENMDKISEKGENKAREIREKSANRIKSIKP